MATTTATQVQQLYVGLLGRAADQGGLNWWVDQITTGGRTLEDIRASFVTSTEYTNLYGGANTTRSDLVTAIYQNLFERTPSAGELNYWVSTDTRPADQLVSAFLEFASTNDQKTIANKVFVAQTYTDTVGTTNFSKAGAAAAIADVDGTPASVSTAITAIANGTLAGQVPGVTQINALATAETAQNTYETTNKAAADALVTSILTKATTAGLAAASTQTDDIVAGSTFQAKVDAVVNDAGLLRSNVSSSTTTILTTDASDKAATLTTAYNALSSTVAAGAPAGTLSQKAQADAYVAAVAAEATAKAAATTDVTYAAVLAGLTADTTATTALGADTAAEVYSNYVNGDAAARTAIDTTFKDSTYYATFKEAAVKDAAYADAHKATVAAQNVLDSDTTANASLVLHSASADSVTVTIATDAVAGSSETQAYVDALTAKTAADTTLANAKAADVDVAAAKALSDAYKAQTTAVSDAKAAVDAISVAGKVAVTDLAVSTSGTAAVKDVFYFGTKATAADDHIIAANNFGTGDSIVLGSSYAYNSGALSTGDNNKLEFFLVQKDADVLVVVETAAYGSSTTTNTAAGAGVVASPDAAVITLTGVTLDHVAVNNGVISYV